MLASAFVISGLTSFADLGASQLGYAAGGLKTIGITDPSVAAACFWIAKTLEALGGLLLAGAPLLSLLGVSSERAAEKLGAAMLLVFIAAVTPCLHPPSGDVQQFLKVRRAARRASGSPRRASTSRRDSAPSPLSGARSLPLSRLTLALQTALARWSCSSAVCCTSSPTTRRRRPPTRRRGSKRRRAARAAVCAGQREARGTWMSATQWGQRVCYACVCYAFSSSLWPAPLERRRAPVNITPFSASGVEACLILKPRSRVSSA